MEEFFRHEMGSAEGLSLYDMGTTDELSKHEMGSAERLSLYDMGATDELSKHEKINQKQMGCLKGLVTESDEAVFFQAHLSDLWEKQRRRALRIYSGCFSHAAHPPVEAKTIA